MALVDWWDWLRERRDSWARVACEDALDPRGLLALTHDNALARYELLAGRVRQLGDALQHPAQAVEVRS